MESFYNNENVVVVTPKEIEEDEEKRKGREERNIPSKEQKPIDKMYFHKLSPRVTEDMKIEYKFCGKFFPSTTVQLSYQ